MLEGAIRSATLGSGGTHLQYRGCDSSEERQRQGSSPSVGCCDTVLYRALKAAKTDWFDTVFTVILQKKLDDKTQLKWAEFSSDHESVPPCTDLLKFLDLQARQLQSVTQVGHKHTAGSDRKMPSVKPSYAISTDDARLACKKRGHQIHTCSVFKGWIWVNRIIVVKELGLCMNCLRAGHIAEKCRAPSMCKKCTRLHHTLLH